MNLKKLSISILLCSSIISLNYVHASEKQGEYDERNENFVDNKDIYDNPELELFPDLKDSDKVIELPDGGFLHGKANVIVEDLSGIKIETYDSSTDPEAKTIETIKHEIIYLGEQVFQGPALVLIKEQATHQKNLLEKAGILVAIAFMQKIGL